MDDLAGDSFSSLKRDVLLRTCFSPSMTSPLSTPPTKQSSRQFLSSAAVLVTLFAWYFGDFEGASLLSGSSLGSLDTISGLNPSRPSDPNHGRFFDASATDPAQDHLLLLRSASVGGSAIMEAVPQFEAGSKALEIVKPHGDKTNMSQTHI